MGGGGDTVAGWALMDGTALFDSEEAAGGGASGVVVGRGVKEVGTYSLAVARIMPMEFIST